MMTRRNFLGAAVIGAAGATSAGVVRLWLNSMRAPREQSRPKTNASLAVSLVEYQRQLAAAHAGGGDLSNALRTVYGLNVIAGLVQVSGRDVLLVGDQRCGGSRCKARLALSARWVFSRSPTVVFNWRPIRIRLLRSSALRTLLGARQE